MRIIRLLEQYKTDLSAKACCCKYVLSTDKYFASIKKNTTLGKRAVETGAVEEYWGMVLRSIASVCVYTVHVFHCVSVLFVL